MSSEFDQYFEDASCFMQEQFAERTPNGDLDKHAVVFHRLGQAKETRVASFANYQTERVDYDQLGNEVREYQDTVEVTLYDGPVPMGLSAKIERFGEPDWHIDERLPEGSDTICTYRLKRGRPYSKQKPGLDGAGR